MDLLVLVAQLAWAAVAVLIIWRFRLYRPARSKPHPPDQHSALLPALPGFLLLTAAIVWLAQPIGLGSARALLGLTDADLGTPRGLAWTFAGMYAGALVAFGLAAVALPPVARAVDLRTRPVHLALATGAFLLIYPLLLLVAWAGTSVAHLLSPDTPIDPLAHKTLRTFAADPFSPWTIAAAVLVIIGAPLIEEIIYRGCLQTALRKATRSPALAIAGTSILFTMMHVGSVETHALPVLLALSIGFGVAYERSRSIAVPIVMHALFNATNIALALRLVE